MVVYPDSSLDSIPAGTGAGAGGPSVSDQINSALSAWYDAIEPYYPTIYIDTTYPGTQGGSNIVVNYSALGPGTCGRITWSGSPATSATITFDSAGNCTDNTIAAYQNYYYKLAMHELGHAFGLADWYQGDPCNTNPYQGQTVMAQMCFRDDSGGAIPTNPTVCDSGESYTIYSGTSDPTCGGGGGGGGGTCTDDGGSCVGDGDCCNSDCENNLCGGFLDPIILDLTGHGYQLTNVANGVKFDFFGTGTPIQMSWTAADWDGGFLALDRDGNGRIDNGTELFSNITPQPTKPGQPANGFLALSVYDLPANGGNGDGWIDEQDAIFSKLLVWVDKNHNGVSDPGELLTLRQAGIQAISLDYSRSQWRDSFGNIFRFSSRSRTNPSPNQPVYDVILQTDEKPAATTAATGQ